VFGIIKKKPQSPMDAIIRTLYGDHPPAKCANLAEAGRIAYEELLCGKVEFSQIQGVADGLFRGPIPYSTHELAVSVALNFFKRPALKDKLSDVQLGARLWVAKSLREGKLVNLIAQTFEDALYKIYQEPPKPAQQKMLDHIEVERFNSLNPNCSVTFHKLTNKCFGVGHSEQQFEIEEISSALDKDYHRCQSARKGPGVTQSIENLLPQIAEGLRSLSLEHRQPENLETAGGAAALGFIRKIVFGLGPGLSSNGPDEARVIALYMIRKLAELFKAEPPKTFLRGVGNMFGCFLAEHLDESPMPGHVENIIPQVKAAFDQYVRSKDLLETTLGQLVECLCEGKTSRVKSIVYQELEDRIDEICEENTDAIKKLSIDTIAVAESVPWEGSENAPTSQQSFEEWKAFDNEIKKWKEEVFRRLNH
jgi:hypothetical protein